MKTITLGSLVALAMVGAAPAASLFTASNLMAAIPDMDINGYQNSQIVSGVPGTISAVTVNLDITEGFNSDLYVFLQHDGALAILLNRSGVDPLNDFGYANTGFAITLNDSANDDVHFYRNNPFTVNGSGQLLGAWQPDGRLIDPLSPASAFDDATRDHRLNVFDGCNPNGTWTLFAADVSSGEISILNEWGLAITTVPEPGSLSLLGWALLGGLGWALRRGKTES